MKILLALLCALLFLHGCDKSEPPPDIIKPQREALEKAKGVEDTLQRSADERRAQIEEAEKPKD